MQQKYQPCSAFRSREDRRLISQRRVRPFRGNKVDKERLYISVGVCIARGRLAYRPKLHYDCHTHQALPEPFWSFFDAAHGTKNCHQR